MHAVGQESGLIDSSAYGPQVVAAPAPFDFTNPAAVTELQQGMAMAYDMPELPTDGEWRTIHSDLVQHEVAVQGAVLGWPAGEMDTLRRELIHESGGQYYPSPALLAQMVAAGGAVGPHMAAFEAQCMPIAMNAAQGPETPDNALAALKTMNAGCEVIYPRSKMLMYFGAYAVGAGLLYAYTRRRR